MKSDVQRKAASEPGLHNLACLTVQRDPFQTRTIFLHFDPSRLGFLVLGSGIVAVAGFCAGQSYNYSHSVHLLLYNRNNYDLHILHV